MSQTTQTPPVARHPSSQSGIALILTLAILAISTLLVIAFMISMRVESMSAKNYNDGVSAREIAKAAVAQAEAQIRSATPLQSATAQYVTLPGMIVTRQSGTNTSVALYPSGSTDTVDLNSGFVITGQNSVFSGTNATLSLNWVNVYTNGPSGSGTIVGRYVYWVDDEACKLNVNSVWKRPNGGVISNAFGYGDTSEIDWRVLESPLNTTALADEVKAGRTQDLYTTTAEVQQADTASFSTTEFRKNQFYLTAYSSESDTNDAQGQPRLILGTLTKANSLVDSTTLATSAYARLADPNLNTTLYPLLGTFADKYGADGLKQIVANIIAYQQDPTVTPPPDGGSEPPAYLGLGKTPYINEIQVKYDASTSAVTRTVSVELFYPYNDGSYASSSNSVLVSGLPPVTGLPAGVSFSATATITTNSVTFGPASAIQFLVDTTIINTALVGQATIAASSPVKITYKNASDRLDYASPSLDSVTLDVPLGAGVTHAWNGSEVNDPRANELANQWTAYSHSSSSTSTTNGTLGGTNSVYAPTGTADSKACMMRGAPMRSIGELGFIHRPNVAWEHLLLQPRPSSESSKIPDWAMLDMFTVTNTPPVGRLNINQRIFPGFPAGTARLAPLTGLLTNVLSTTSNFLANAVGDVSTSYGSALGFANAYDTIGEICEVASLTNGLATEKDKEEPIRRIANLITVRSNAFSVWVLAQAVKQLPSGKLTVTGEIKAQAVVERYVDTSAGPATVKFRTLYFHYLTD